MCDRKCICKSCILCKGNIECGCTDSRPQNLNLCIAGGVKKCDMYKAKNIIIEWLYNWFGVIL